MLYNNGIEVIDPTELTGAIKSRDNVYQNINQMIKGAEESIIIMTTATGLSRKADVLKRNLEKASKRGVDVKIAAPINKISRNAVETLKGIAEIKHVDSIKARFVIVDGKHVVFNLMDDEKTTPNYDAGIWVNTEFFAGALHKMFNQIWQQREAVAVQ